MNKFQIGDLVLLNYFLPEYIVVGKIIDYKENLYTTSRQFRIQNKTKIFYGSIVTNIEKWEECKLKKFNLNLFT